jgi:DNA helicase-2/ATP-dependent DNA helicase PcrA
MPLKQLNSEQIEAVESPFGKNLIIASAGTGKTSTIVGRIYHLIKYRDIKPEEILLLTFTNKASAEMIARVGKYFGSSIANRIEAGTFHSVSYRYIKKYNKGLILKQEKDIKTLFRSIYEKRNFHLREGETEHYSSRYLYETYNFYQNVELEADFGDWLEENKPDHKIYIDIYSDIIEEYEKAKRSYGFMNFNDLLLNMRSSLRENGAKYREVLVDEYQDTNSLQGAIIDDFQSPSLFCVGDYDQSIYAFNGANIEIIGTFKDRYSDANIYTLKKNYRSTEPILRLANRVIEGNERLYPKELQVTKTGGGLQPKLLTSNSLNGQYELVAKKISQSNREVNNIAVLFRNNSSGDGIEAMLRQYNINSKRKGSRGIFETKEVKALIDLYTVLANHRDMMAFIHIFEYIQGIGVATARELFSGLSRLGNGNIYSGLSKPDRSISNPFESGRTNTQLLLSNHFEELGTVSRFKELKLPEFLLSNPILKHPKLSKDGVQMLFNLLKLKKAFNATKSPSSAVQTIFRSEIYKYIVEFLSDDRSKLPNGQKSPEKRSDAQESIKRRVENILNLSKKYSEHLRFLNAMILAGNDATTGDGVNLMSVHGSKGLEYDEVYIVDLMDGRFPNSKLAKGGGGVEEERRLFYVAVTRAREELYLSYAKWEKDPLMQHESDRDNDKKNRQFQPSQFLKEGGLIL